MAIRDSNRDEDIDTTTLLKKHQDFQRKTTFSWISFAFLTASLALNVILLGFNLTLLFKAPTILQDWF
jgi:hypothetical protein